MSMQRPPGPKGNFLTGNLAEFGADQPNYLWQLAEQYGDMVYFRLANLHIYLLAHSDLVREVLVTQADKFEKAPLDRKILGKFLGNGLLTSEGTLHARQRRLAQPAFHMKRIRTYAEVMVAYSEHLLDEWQDGQMLDMADEMMKLTMAIVSKTLFDADAVTTSGDTAVIIGHAIHDLQTASN
ncbi:MAG: cytochrome P450, partial [Anaerolineae bacterium]|nr:cytochrome P450 [Anaerolineae bacterium]